MKKLLFSLAALCICTGAFAQKGEKSVGLSFNYGTEIETLGFGLKFNYNLTDDVRMAPNFTFFLKKNYHTMWDVNLDFNYLFRVMPKFNIYPIAGLSLATIHRQKIGELPSDNLTKFGVNLGAGFEYDITREWAVNLEMKYRIMSDIDQGVIGIGAIYRF